MEAFCLVPRYFFSYLKKEAKSKFVKLQNVYFRAVHFIFVWFLSEFYSKLVKHLGPDSFPVIFVSETLAKLNYASRIVRTQKSLFQWEETFRTLQNIFWSEQEFWKKHILIKSLDKNLTKFGLTESRFLGGI